jgi:alpha-glucosidase/alpha-D-xyloside xylohydrolase
MAGCTHDRDAYGNDVFRSPRLVVHLSADPIPPSRLPHPMPLDELNQSLRDHYFGGGSGNRRNDDTVSVTTVSGEALLTMRNWSMVPNRSEVEAPNEAKPNDVGSRVSAIFDSPADEHYYGLGQQQQGALDLRDHRINCWHDYSAIGGENLCSIHDLQPRIWSGLGPPSKPQLISASISAASGRLIGDRVSFFVIQGDNSDDIYKVSLPPASPMLPRATYGYIRAGYLSNAGSDHGSRKGISRSPASATLWSWIFNMTRQGELIRPCPVQIQPP